MAKEPSIIKVSLVLPVFNEGVNLDIFLRIAQAILKLPHEMLVVYDFPEDNSIPVTKEVQKIYPQVRLVHNTLGRGAVNAIKAGVNDSRGKYAVTLMADDIGPLFAISAMTDLMDQGCELVGCTRYAFGGRVFGGSPAQKVLSRIANRFFCLLTTSRLTDLTFGVKMFRPELFKELQIETKSGWPCFELGVKVQARGAQVGEVPITSINRFYGGEPSFALKSWALEYIKW